MDMDITSYLLLPFLVQICQQNGIHPEQGKEREEVREDNNKQAQGQRINSALNFQVCFVLDFVGVGGVVS